MKCQTCLCWTPLKHDGECRRRAPVPVLLALSDGLLTRWPKTLATEGCGDWMASPVPQKSDTDLRLEVIARALGLPESATVEEILGQIDCRRKITESFAKRIVGPGEMIGKKAELPPLTTASHQPEQVFGSLPVDPREEE
jgi:hypothetical protein